MSFFSRPQRKVDPEVLKKQAEATIQQVQAQQPRVNVLTAYLQNRNNQNGFGEDFEYTLRPKGAA